MFSYDLLDAKAFTYQKINTKNLIKSQVPHPPYEKYFES